MTLHMPALRERPMDIAPIAQGLLERAMNGRSVRGFTTEALACIGAYRWPGNVRELHNEIQRMLALSEGDWLGAELLSPRVLLAAAEESQERELSLLAGLDGSLKERVEQLEARLIKEVLVRHRWNRTRTAEELGLSRVGLRQKMNRFGLEKL
jgi:two-component system response regulator HupR/HoxA